ncbi:MAG: SpoIIE family protein phosphatase [bacterium]
MSNANPFRRIFDLYTSDLSFAEIERLIKRESAEVYEYFAADIPQPDTSRNKFIRALVFIRSLFNAFILKLKPARRIFYLAAILFFVVGILQDREGYTILAFIILNLLLAFELADKLTAKDELGLARKIQATLVPKPPFENKYFDISSYYESAREVGGDYFDVIKSPNEDKTYVVVGDISGKGMAAAIYMVRVQAIIHLLIKTYSNLKDIVIELKTFFSMNLEKEYFLTMVASSINPDGSVSICRAGHLPVLYYSKKENTLQSLNTKGIGIGLNDKGIFEKTLEEITIVPECGDMFILYSDGLTEAMNDAKVQFGEEALKKIITKHADKSVDEIRNRIVDAIIFFRGSTPQYDDLTMLLLKAK